MIRDVGPAAGLQPGADQPLFLLWGPPQYASSEIIAHSTAFSVALPINAAE
jgi:hypothetical protein